MTRWSGRKLLVFVLVMVCAVALCVPAYAADETITDEENNVSYKLTYDTVLRTYPAADLKKVEISEISITARKGQSPSGSFLHIAKHAGTGGWTQPRYTTVDFSNGGADTDCTQNYSTSYSLKPSYKTTRGEWAVITLSRTKTSGHTWGDTWNMASDSTTVHERECTHAVCIQKDTCTAAWTSCVNNGNGTHTFTCEEGHVVTVNCSGGTATCTEKATCEYCNTPYGSVDETNHNWGSDYINNGNEQHYQVCTRNSDHHSDPVNCSGGAATCTEKATCAYCSTPYGTELGHDWGDWVSNNNGTHTRTCKNDSNHTETANCSGGTATCTEQATCEYCNTHYGSVDETNHNWGSDYISNGNGQHYQVCTRNSDHHSDPVNCSGGAATCTEKATCEYCNTPYGTELGHDWGDWVSNNNDTHTRTCKNDSNHAETVSCSGGTATCTEKATCEYCSTPYGTELGHDWGDWVSNDNNTHTRTCKNDSNHTETANCSGGAATCTEKATCEYCNAPYGTELGHDWGDWVSNDNNTHTRTCKNDSNHTETANCSGGTATCTEKAICEYCSTPYGSVDETNHNWDSGYISNGNGQHYQVCTRNSDHHSDPVDCSGGTATCTEQATCEHCSTPYGSVDETNHNWGSDYVSNGKGQHYQVCTRNSDHHSDPVDCSGGTATCIEPAICEHCHDAYGETDPDHHRPVSVPAVRPTQTENGLTEGVVCGDCGTVLVPQRILSMLSTDVPQTGDSSHLVLWIILMVSSLAGIALILMAHRRKQN